METLNSLFNCIAGPKTQAIDTLAEDIMHTKFRHDTTDNNELKKLYRDIVLLQLQKLKEMLTAPIDDVIEETKEQEY